MERLKFEIECPNNHDQTVKFDQKEFEEKLKSGGLMFHCEVCDTNWPPTPGEISHFRKEFAKNSS
jgi:hypothetical protein